MNIIKNQIVIFEEGNSDSPSIIFVHGFPYDHHMWDKVVGRLSKDFYCITYDIRGLGLSGPGDGQYTMESMVDDLFFVMDKMSLDEPTLCGLSMGGYISLRAVEREEERFSKLILCDTKSSSDPDEVKLKRSAGIKTINEEGVQKFSFGFVPTCFAEESIERLEGEYTTILNRSMSYNPVGVKGCLLAMAGRTDTTSYLSKIKIPTLILCGENDKLTTPAQMQEMADKINNSEFHVVPESGHMIPVENPDFVYERMREFLA